MTAAALRRRMGGVKMVPLPTLGIQRPVGWAHPLVLVLLLASTNSQSQTVSRSEMLKPNAPTPDRNASIHEDGIKSSTPQISTSLLQITNTEKHEGTSVSPHPSPASSLTQEEEAGKRLDPLVEDGHLLRLQSSTSVDKDRLKNGYYGKPNIDSSPRSRDNGSSVTLRGNKGYMDNGSNVTLGENKGYMDNEPSEKSPKNPYANMGDDSHLIFHFIILCFCVTLIYIIYYNKRNISLLMQKKKWRGRLYSPTMKCYLHQNVNQAMPSQNFVNDYMF